MVLASRPVAHLLLQSWGRCSQPLVGLAAQGQAQGQGRCGGDIAALLRRLSPWAGAALGLSVFRGANRACLQKLYVTGLSSYPICDRQQIDRLA
jgi:hypothetical protein